MIKNYKIKRSSFFKVLLRCSLYSAFLCTWGCSSVFVFKPALKTNDPVTSESPQTSTTTAENPVAAKNTNRVFDDNKPTDSLFEISKTSPKLQWREELATEHLELNLLDAVISFTTEIDQPPREKKSKIKAKMIHSEVTIELLTDQSSEACVAALRFREGHVEIRGNHELKCAYLVDIKLAKAAPLDLKLGNGDINLNQAGAVQVQCTTCNLTGEFVSGPVSYKIENGNVGLEGLEDSVQGETNGDTVLVWRKVSKNLKVNVKSKEGDVALDFPSSARIAPDVHVGRGDVFYQINKNSSDGLPVRVDASIGNVKLYQAGYRLR